MRETARNKTKRLTVCAMLAAMGVVILELGSLVEVLDLTASVLASILCIYAVIELGGAYPWLLWGVTSLCACLLLYQKTPAVFYTLFTGFYPILKERFERRSRWICILEKLIAFHLSLGGIYLVFRLFFPGVPESTGFFVFALYGLALVCFIIYDIALTRLITFYLRRLQRHFRIK